MPVESLQTGQFRHGPLELAGPDLAAILIATEPETRSLDLALADELLAPGAGVLAVVAEEDRISGDADRRGATRSSARSGRIGPPLPTARVATGHDQRPRAGRFLPRHESDDR